MRFRVGAYTDDQNLIHQHYQPDTEPYVRLERMVEENKDGYYRALRASQKQIRSEGENLDDWLRFFLTSLKKQKDVLLGKIEREQLLEKLAPLEENILAITRERGRITIVDAVTLLSATTPSSCICATWFSRGIWSNMGQGRGRGIQWGDRLRPSRLSLR